MVTAIHCGADTFLDAARTVAISADHSMYLYSDGSVMTYCEINNGTKSASGFVIWRSGQSGADNGLCLVQNDLNNANSGFWRFTSPTMRAAFPASSATYNDVGNTYNGAAVSMSCTRS